MKFFFKKALHYREGCETLKLFWGEQQPSECQTASGGCNFFALFLVSVGNPLGRASCKGRPGPENQAWMFCSATFFTGAL